MTFELAGGSVVGRDHRVVPKNNQDAYWIDIRRYPLTFDGRVEEVSVAVVCDGCGSGTHSEVGASIGARLLCRSIHLELQAHGEERFLWKRVEQDVLSSIHVLAAQLGGNYRETIEDYFLFTITGIVLTAETVSFFGVGDGLVIVNGDPHWDGPWPGNAPPYLCYQLLDTPGFAQVDLQLSVLESLNTKDLDSFLIGCDGAGRPGLLQICEENQIIPGMKNMNTGPISEFWTMDHYFENPVAISRRLKLFTRDWPPRDPEYGLLGDDTTIVVGRRTPWGD